MDGLRSDTSSYLKYTNLFTIREHGELKLGSDFLKTHSESQRKLKNFTEKVTVVVSVRLETRLTAKGRMEI